MSSKESAPKKVKYLILGAGPCGLGAAYRLNDLGIDDFYILEKSKKVGGLATSYKDEKGFTWDIGGHVQFSHYDYFDRAMEDALGTEGWFHHQREAWVWIKERFIPYPFQNNIHRLPPDDRDNCLKGLEERINLKELNNFQDWLDSSFGKGLCDLFMNPYNFKVWAYNPKEMNYKWIGERVAQIDLDRIKKNIEHNQDDVNWGPNNTFQFPKYGGTGAIWESIGKKIGLEKIALESNVKNIDPKKKVVKTDEFQIEYESILSTIPLTTLSHCIEDDELIELSSKLLSSGTHVIGIGLKGQTPNHLETKCWMYFPESNSPFYRVTVFSNYSPNNVPNINEQFSLMAEVSESNHKPVNKERVVEEVIQGLKNCKLINDEEILSTWHFHAPLGYPTPSLGRDGVLNKLIPKLEDLGITSRGRFGAWKYEVSNQDHTFMQGVEWINKMEKGIDEETFKLS